jgi:argininosuccinate lyase
MVKNLPLTYNRDLQEDKPPLFDSFRTLCDCLAVLAELIPGMVFQKDRCAEAVSDPLLLATDLADHLVEQGTPFREAHHQVGALVALSEKLGTPINELPEERARELSPRLGEKWREIFDLKRAMAKRAGTGMPSSHRVREQIALWRSRTE